MSQFNIPHLRLVNQHLARPSFDQPGDLVAWLGAVQAQDYAGSKWALGLRLRQATDELVEQAFAQGSILRTHVMRPTWHFVSPADIRWMLALTGPRLIASSALRYRQLELEPPDFSRSRLALEQALHGGRHLTREELRPVLEHAGVRLHIQQRLSHLLGHLEMEGLICSGPRRGKQHTYMLLDERVPATKSLSRDDSLAELARRYFASRGPATLQDFAWWSGLSAAEARSGLEMVKDQFTHAEIGGKTVWFSDSTQPLGKMPQAAYLLPYYDEYTISYLDRRLISEAASRDQSLLNPMVLLRGQLVGAWKRTLKKNAVELEMKYFRSLSKAETGLVTAAAQHYGAFLGLAVEWA